MQFVNVVYKKANLEHVVSRNTAMKQRDARSRHKRNIIAKRTAFRGDGKTAKCGTVIAVIEM